MTAERRKSEMMDMSADFRRKVETVTDFLSKIGAMDIDGAGRHLAEDATMVLPYLEELGPLAGRAAIIDQIKGTVPEMFERMDFTFDAWYPAGDPDVLIAEYRSVCPRRGNGGTYRNTYISVFRFKDGKITLYKEYLNPLKLNPGA